jgi:hypothetical protein
MSNLVRRILEEFNDEEKKQIKSWAENAYIIKNDFNLTNIQKIRKLHDTSTKNKIVQKFFKSVALNAKKYGWDERSIPARFAMSGALIGVTVAGASFAGIASAGFGIGVPFFILTSAGGALLGTILQELKKRD